MGNTINMTTITNNTNMQDLVGTGTVQLYNNVNEFLLGLGFTVIGALLLCVVLAIVLKPLFYLFFTIKLGYQGTREIFRIVYKFFSFTRYIIKEIYKYSKKLYLKHQNKTITGPALEKHTDEDNDEEE